MYVYIIESTIIPCDALLLSGSCLVNEAMLTGESAPQPKESLSACEDLQAALRLSLDSSDEAIWRKHVVYSGTTLMQQLSGVHAGSTGGVGERAAAPDKGCVVLVVRTAFGTSQVYI